MVSAFLTTFWWIVDRLEKTWTKCELWTTFDSIFEKRWIILESAAPVMRLWLMRSNLISIAKLMRIQSTFGTQYMKCPNNLWSPQNLERPEVTYTHDDGILFQRDQTCKRMTFWVVQGKLASEAISVMEVLCLTRLMSKKFRTVCQHQVQASAECSLSEFIEDFLNDAKEKWSKRSSNNWVPTGVVLYV